MRARLGDFDGAFEDVGEFRRRLRELGRETEYAVTSSCVWDVCLWAGDWKRGEEALREGYEMLNAMGSTAVLSTITLDLGDCVFRQGCSTRPSAWAPSARSSPRRTTCSASRSH
jgi:hypothetical protein